MRALIGYTGFVGSNLLNQTTFEEKFNTSNIQEVKNNEFDMVICAAPSAAKWKANKFPDEDLAMVKSLIENIKKVKTKHFIQISTIDVYDQPRDVDEDTDINPTLDVLHAYGKHRFFLEEEIKKTFENHLIVRLPALFGKGLKKNFIFDLLNDNALEYTDKDSEFQFYNLENLYSDISKALENNINLLNVTSEPLVAEELAKEIFDIEFTNKTDRPTPKYDIRSKHSKYWGREDGYLYSKDQVMKEISLFVNNYIQ